MKKNRIVAIFFFFVMLSSFCFAESDNSLLIKGLEAYREKDWTSALFFFKKAATLETNNNAETWYVLIMSEVNASDFEGVLTDGAYFIRQFSDSSYVSQIKYQMARATLLLEDYNQALVMFDEFCNLYPNHELYSSALFWKAECFYQLYDYAEAQVLYEELLSKYPTSSKCLEAAFRIELLQQREREEKLLYLLRVTGEENLAAREDYERQIKQYQSEESINFKMKVTELTLLVESLQQELEESNARIENLLKKVNDLTLQNEELKIVSEDAKKSAAIAAYEAELQKIAYEQQILDEKVLMEAQKLIQDVSKTNTENEVETEIQVETEESYESEVDIELKRLKEKAKELEELLKK